MAKQILSPMGAAGYVQHGYGQVEPNHLSAQRNGQIYAQLPAAAGIDVLENGQFAKYDYQNGVVNFSGAGEWMLVLNEVKLYRDHMNYDDFALVAADYAAKVYSPVDGVGGSLVNVRDYSGVVTAADIFEPDSTNNPFVIEKFNAPKMMPTGTRMVPRLFKTSVGDIFTTNTVKETTLALGDILTPGADGYLAKLAEGATPDMKWQVVKVYTLADHQKAVKIMRIA